MIAPLPNSTLSAKHFFFLFCVLSAGAAYVTVLWINNVERKSGPRRTCLHCVSRRAAAVVVHCSMSSKKGKKIHPLPKPNHPTPPGTGIDRRQSTLSGCALNQLNTIPSRCCCYCCCCEIQTLSPRPLPKTLPQCAVPPPTTTTRGACAAFAYQLIPFHSGLAAPHLTRQGVLVWTSQKRAYN